MSALMMINLAGFTQDNLPIKIKMVPDVLPTSVQSYDSDMRASLTGGNVYWFECFNRGLTAPTGNSQSARLTYSGSINYGVAYRHHRGVAKLEGDTSYDTSSFSAVTEDGSTLTSTSTWLKGTAAGYVFPASAIGIITGLIAPSTDGVLAIQLGVNSNTANGRSMPYSVFRVQQVG